VDRESLAISDRAIIICFGFGIDHSALGLGSEFGHTLGQDSDGAGRRPQ
jgi:hypothetical protein